MGMDIFRRSENIQYLIFKRYYDLYYNFTFKPHDNMIETLKPCVRVTQSPRPTSGPESNRTKYATAQFF